MTMRPFIAAVPLLIACSSDAAKNVVVDAAPVAPPEPTYLNEVGQPCFIGGNPTYNCCRSTSKEPCSLQIEGGSINRENVDVWVCKTPFPSDGTPVGSTTLAIEQHVCQFAGNSVPTEGSLWCCAPFAITMP